MELSLTQKNIELIKLIEINKNGIDFWGDKKTTVQEHTENLSNERLPINVYKFFFKNNFR